MKRNIFTLASVFFRQILPGFIFDKCEHIAKYIVFSEYRDNSICKKKYGKLNCDKVFYVFRIDKKEIGVLSTYLLCLDELQDVEKKGYIPVFDMKNQENVYNQNEWSCYFNTVNACNNIDEVYKSRNVILGWKNGNGPKRIRWMEKILTEDEIIRFNKLAVKYMGFSSEIKERAKTVLDKTPFSEKVLGLALRASFLRGELLKKDIFQGHPKQKTLSETIKLAKQMMERWQCEYIFVSVEDREWLEEFKKEFGEKCLYLERERVHFFWNGNPIDDTEEVYSEFENISMKKRTMDYLTEVYILSKCNSLFGSLSSGMTVAQILNNNKYEHTNICYNGAIKI